MALEQNKYTSKTFLFNLISYYILFFNLYKEIVEEEI